MLSPRICLLAAPVAALALGACGGGDDREEAEQTVREFVKATSERDADRFCEDLVTQEFLEKTTGATGEDATGACKDQLDSLRELDVELVRIDRVQIDGDEAEVTATILRQGQAAESSLQLEKEDGDWRIDGGAQ